MRPLILVLGVGLIIIGGYHPFNIWTVLVGIVLTLFGIFSKKKENKK